MHANFFLETLKQQTRISHPQRRVSRSSLLSRPQREHPVAVCTRCAAFSFSENAISQPCGRPRAGLPCTGKFASTSSKNVWQKCPTCEATGWQHRMVCSQCQSLGWLFSRHH